MHIYLQINTNHVAVNVISAAMLLFSLKLNVAVVKTRLRNQNMYCAHVVEDVTVKNSDYFRAWLLQLMKNSSSRHM